MDTNLEDLKAVKEQTMPRAMSWLWLTSKVRAERRLWAGGQTVSWLFPASWYRICPVHSTRPAGATWERQIFPLINQSWRDKTVIVKRVQPCAVHIWGGILSPNKVLLCLSSSVPDPDPVRSEPFRIRSNCPDPTKNCHKTRINLII